MSTTLVQLPAKHVGRLAGQPLRVSTEPRLPGLDFRNHFRRGRHPKCIRPLWVNYNSTCFCKHHKLVFISPRSFKPCEPCPCCKGACRRRSFTRVPLPLQFLPTHSTGFSRFGGWRISRVQGTEALFRVVVKNCGLHSIVTKYPSRINIPKPNSKWQPSFIRMKDSSLSAP